MIAPEMRRWRLSPREEAELRLVRAGVPVEVAMRRVEALPTWTPDNRPPDLQAGDYWFEYETVAAPAGWRRRWWRRLSAGRWSR